MSDYVLKIDCVDSKGLIYKISKTLFTSELNIIKNDEFVDKQSGKFFFRAIINGDIKKNNLVEELKQEMPKGANIKLLKQKQKKIVVMATKESHCLGDLLIREFSENFNAKIVCVVSNHNSLKELVCKFNIPYYHISHEGLSKEGHEQNILEVLRKYEFDYIVLAKYMRILSSEFVGKFNGNIINIHHSFLPAFIGANPYKQAFQRGVKTIGATAHFVNDNLDEGPIIAQDVISVTHEFSWKDMQKFGQNVEKTVLSNALDLVFEDRVFLLDNKSIIF